MKLNETEKIKIGVVAVDSGKLMICAPLYLNDWKNNKFEREYKTKDFSYSTLTHQVNNEMFTQFKFPAGHAGLAVAFLSNRRRFELILKI